MARPTAVVLIAHGSPDPDWRRPLEAVHQRLADALPDVTVMVAYLGFLEPRLPDAVAGLVAQGHRDVLVLSAFLSPGGNHIKRDVPALVAQVAKQHPQLSLLLRPGALGAEPEVIEALTVAAKRAVAET